MNVGGWLRSLGLDKYEAAFLDNGIGEAVLPYLTVEDLKEIGVATVGDRRMLLAAIAALATPTSSESIGRQPSSALPTKATEVAAERRPITVMFCDLVGSTGLAAKLDPEDWRNLVNAYLDEASGAVTALGGHVLKKLGDGLMALFGYPKAQENDAERALRAALAIQRALAELNSRNAAKGAPQLAARIGLDSGPVVVERTGEVFGDAPNVAARVQAAAESGTDGHHYVGLQHLRGRRCRATRHGKARRSVSLRPSLSLQPVVASRSCLHRSPAMCRWLG
jgi:class 3 adenylate cyclase